MFHAENNTTASHPLSYLPLNISARPAASHPPLLLFPSYSRSPRHTLRAPTQHLSAGSRRQNLRPPSALQLADPVRAARHVQSESHGEEAETWVFGKVADEEGEEDVDEED
ncbi:hypothetical protein ACN47E_001141 [Coniothyrium glycines]